MAVVVAMLLQESTCLLLLLVVLLVLAVTLRCYPRRGMMKGVLLRVLLTVAAGTAAFTRVAPQGCPSRGSSMTVSRMLLARDTNYEVRLLCTRLL